MNLAPIAAWLTTTLTALMTLALPLVGIALFVAGAYWALGNSNHGKEKAFAAFLGGVLMLSAQSLATSLHIGSGTAAAPGAAAPLHILMLPQPPVVDVVRV